MSLVRRVRVAVVPQIAPPSALLTLGQPRSVVICLPSAHPILNSPMQVRALVVHCAGRKDQITLLEVTRYTRQEEISSCENVEEEANRLSSTMVAFAAATLVAASRVNEVQAVESLGFDAGAAFERTCAGCHSGGGNILQPAATLSKEDLERNGVIGVDDIYKITYSGKNRMPGYGKKCGPRGQCTFGPRLSEENIRALAEFVKLQADQGWPKR